MKKALKVIIPLLLSVAVICSMAWYFLVYDRDFTKDLLLWSARTLEQEGKHELAAWVYNITYEQASFEDDIAIELANQYKTIGNYTKAEYTISEAIASKPTTDLYIALCNLYVQQDKLLDAIKLLDTVSSPEIRAELEAMRPTAPVLSPEAGFYSQYITVEANADGATLFVNTNGEYPTTEKDLYTAPISLPQGETVLYALSVSDNGLVSPLTISGYTIGGVIEKVTFSDPAMETAMRLAIGADENDVIFTNALWNVKSFTIPAEAQTYSDLAYLPYLESLEIPDAANGELVHLKSLSQLTDLHVENGSLSEDELSAIGQLTGLKRLTLSNCGISSIASLSHMNQLQYLDLSQNTIRNLSVIGDMQELEELYLNNNVVTDLTSLSSLTKLRMLDVSYNSLKSVDPIRSITALTYLNFSHNEVSDVRMLTSLVALIELNASYNALTDVTAISSCTALEVLNISNNTVADISGLNTLIKINNLDFSYNQVKKLPVFDKSCPLVYIDGSYNQIEDLKSLSSLKNLNVVLMDFNEKLASLEPLDSCPRLVKVNAYGTKVSEVRFLTDKSIIVNYNPANDKK
jgi:Leucine-rich repeat (LRR) protein